MLIYKNQAKREKLAAKTGLSFTGNRLSDMSSQLFGARGNEYDELQYLRHQNTDAQAVNQKLSDAYVKMAPANGSGSTSNRYDNQYHDLLTNGTYP
jgi:hypothetical protein